jgi:hypothetical protein
MDGTLLAYQHYREEMRRIGYDPQKEREKAERRFQAYLDRIDWNTAHPPPVSESRTPRQKVKKRGRWKQNASSQYVARLLAAHVAGWGFSDRKSAKWCGVSQSFFARIINGQRNVSYATASRMLECLDIHAPLDRVPDDSTPVWAVANCPPRHVRRVVQSAGPELGGRDR